MTENDSLNIDSDIVLRPRFQRNLKEQKESVLQAFEHLGKSQEQLVVKRVDDHVFIRYPKQEQHFWTPQLHLEINDLEDTGSKLYGLFGPNPNIWLAFMFLHFIVATVFIGFSIWAYSNWSLKTDYFFQTVIACSMLVLWILFYIMGRVGRATSKPQMHQLHEFMEHVLNSFKTD